MLPWPRRRRRSTPLQALRSTGRWQARGSLAAAAAFGIRLAAYRFDRYRTTEKPEKKPSVKVDRLEVDDSKAATKAFKRLSGLADAVIFTRDLVSEPANILYPEEFARRVKA